MSTDKIGAAKRNRDSEMSEQKKELKNEMKKEKREIKVVCGREDC